MRKALPLLLLLVACTTTTPVDDPAPDPADDGPLAHLSRVAERLNGAWVDTSANGRTVFHEQWERTGEALHTGLGFVMSGADTVFIEHLKIHWDGTDGWYSARIPSQNDGAFVDFKLEHASDDSLVFVNAAHDFPQRIRYAWEPAGAWHVVVSGLVRDTLRAERFLLRPHPASSAPGMP